MKKNRFLSLLLAALMALALTCPALALEDPQPQAKAVIIVDGDNREVLYDFHAHERMYPASITKIMTSLVVLDAVTAGEISLDTMVTASAQAVDLPWYSSNAGIKAGEVLYDFNARQQMYPASVTKIMTSLVVLDAVDAGEVGLDTKITASRQAVDLPFGSSNAGILAGEELTVLSLLYCDLLPSGNDACNILAEAIGGTTVEFVARMNAKAEELGMKDTHFMNPHGLHDPEHYTTAYDIYLMAHAAMENETFRTIVRSPYYALPATNLQAERTIYTTNAFLGSFYVTNQLYSKAIGIKTGNTDEAGRCLASAAVDELGRTFYCVLLGSEYTQNEDGSWNYWSFSESRRLLEWAFDNFHRVTLLNQDTENVFREVSVTLSDEADYVLAQPVGEIAATMPSDYDPKKAELDFKMDPSVEAPVTAGQKLGTVTFSYEDTVYGTLDMVAMDDVERSEFLYTIQQIELYWSKWWVKAAVIGGAAVVVLFVVYMTAIRPKQRRAKRYSYSGAGRRGGSNYRGRR